MGKKKDTPKKNIPEKSVPKKKAKPKVKKKTPIKDAHNSDLLIKKYNKLSKIMSLYCIHTASDGIEVNLMSFRHRLDDKIEHLSFEEREMIKIKYDHFSKLKPVLASYRRNLKKHVGDDYEGILEVRKTEILELFRRHYSPSEIHEKVIKKSELDIPFKAIQRFALKHKVQIEKLQIDWAKDHNSVTIAKKRSRLEDLNDMLRILKKAIDDAKNDKDKAFFIKDAKGILEQARKEVEGHQIKLDIHGHIDINATIESARGVEQMYAEINFMNLLVARVAAKMRVNPLLLNYQLTNSWYEKITGIKRSKSLMDEQIDYPSKIILGIGWDELKDRAEKKQEEYKKLKNKFTEEVEGEASDDEKEAAERIRQQLKDRMKKRENKLDEVKDSLEGKK